jgi:hypothetical protein
MILKLLQVLGVRGVRHPARILLPKGANDSSSCMRQNTLIRVMKLLVAKWASIAAILGPNTHVMHSCIKLPEDLRLVPPLGIFILVVDIVRQHLYI